MDRHAESMRREGSLERGKSRPGWPTRGNCRGLTPTPERGTTVVDPRLRPEGSRPTVRLVLIAQALSREALSPRWPRCHDIHMRSWVHSFTGSKGSILGPAKQAKPEDQPAAAFEKTLKKRFSGYSSDLISKVTEKNRLAEGRHPQPCDDEQCSSC